MKQALFAAYFGEGADVSDRGVLTQIAVGVGLDRTGVLEILESDRFAADVRKREQFYRNQGINGVPAIIINDRHLIEGGPTGGRVREGAATTRRRGPTIGLNVAAQSKGNYAQGANQAPCCPARPGHGSSRIDEHRNRTRD